jgi:iron(III) transport system permease protein
MTDTRLNLNQDDFLADARSKAARRTTMFTIDRVIWIVVATAVVILVAVPLAFSFDSAFHEETRFGLSPNYSLRALIDVYTSATYLSALWQALWLAFVVTLMSTVVGVAIAVLMARTNLKWKPVLELMVIMPLFLAPFTGLMAWIALGSAKTGFVNVAVVGLLAHFGITSGPLVNIWTWGGTAWVMFLFFMPFVYLFTVNSLRTMDGSLEEAARSAGANPVTVLLKITIPLSMPSILISALVVFMLTAETYTIPGTIGNFAGFDVLSWQIFLDTTGATLKQAHAASAATMLLLVAIACLMLQRFITRKSARFVTITGKGFRGRLLNLRRWQPAALAFVLLYVICATILPFAALVLNSFVSRSSAVITSDLFTLQHYQQFWREPGMRDAFLNTLVLALGAGGLCVAFGFIISLADVRRPGLLTRALAVVSAIPVAVPGLVYGIGLLWLFLKTPFYGTVWVLLFAYIAKFIPFGVVMSRGGLQQIHTDLENSARSSGASAFQAVRYITLPLMKMTLVSILFCVMLLCIKELSASAMLYTNRSQVLSVLTWHYMDSGNYQFAAALGVLQSVIMVGLVLITRFVFRVKLERTMGSGAA